MVSWYISQNLWPVTCNSFLWGNYNLQSSLYKYSEQFRNWNDKFRKKWLKLLKIFQMCWIVHALNPCPESLVYIVFTMMKVTILLFFYLGGHKALKATLHCNTNWWIYCATCKCYLTKIFSLYGNWIVPLACIAKVLTILPTEGPKSILRVLFLENKTQYKICNLIPNCCCMFYSV